MTVCNDGNNLYFQSRFTDYIFKSTPLGEFFWYKSDSFPDNTSDTTSTFMYWRGQGLAWADTNLVALYRHKDDSTQYRGRYVYIKNDTLKTVLDTMFTWDHLDSYGAYALEYNPDIDGFLVLAKDSLNQYILFEVDSNFQNPNSIRVLEGNPMGITLGPNSELYLSYPVRQIERLLD